MLRFEKHPILLALLVAVVAWVAAAGIVYVAPPKPWIVMPVLALTALFTAGFFIGALRRAS